MEPRISHCSRGHTINDRYLSEDLNSRDDAPQFCMKCFVDDRDRPSPIKKMLYSGHCNSHRCISSEILINRDPVNLRVEIDSVVALRCNKCRGYNSIPPNICILCSVKIDGSDICPHRSGTVYELNNINGFDDHGNCKSCATLTAETYYLRCRKNSEQQRLYELHLTAVREAKDAKRKKKFELHSEKRRIYFEKSKREIESNLVPQSDSDTLQDNKPEAQISETIPPTSNAPLAVIEEYIAE